MLIVFGIIIALFSIAALMNQGELNSVNKVTGSAVSETIQSFPNSPNFYFTIFLILGVVAMYMGIHSRKVVY